MMVAWIVAARRGGCKEEQEQRGEKGAASRLWRKIRPETKMG